jgi:DNA-binding NtrC family response regulator
MSDKRVLVVDSLREMLDLISHQLTEDGHDVVGVSSDAEAMEAVREGFDGVVVQALRSFSELEGFEALRTLAPRIPIILTVAHLSPKMRTQAIRQGAFDVLDKDDRFFQRLRAALQAALQHDVVQRAGRRQPRSMQGRRRFAKVIGSSEGMRSVLRKMDQVCESNVSVILHGETGTGKEVVARAIHQHGSRRSEPFVAVNCGAIPGGLLESELFGHERGAFTGAVARKIGRFEMAHGGTLFLDEIGELDLSLQAKLLRVLQEHEIERVGGTARIKVDVRILSATHRDLFSEAFRRDLYYRLAVFPIDIPPLRTRPEDVEELTAHFLMKFGKEQGIEAILEHGVVDRLLSYSFPGNVRELENALRYALVSCEGGRITLEDLPESMAAVSPSLLTRGPKVAGDGPIPQDLLAALFPTSEDIPRVEDVEEQLIQRALHLCDGNVSQASERLGLSRATLYRRLGRIGRKVS